MSDPALSGRPAWARQVTARTSFGPAVLAVDGTGLLVRCSRAARRTAPMSAADGTPTGALLMFISSLAKNLRVIRPHHVLVAWDGPGARAWRQDLYPGYKASRPAQDGDGAELRLARDFCAAASLRQLTVPGFEADDLLAAVQRELAMHRNDYRLVVHSDDSDLLQLLADEMTVITGSNSGAYLTATDVLSGWRVPPWWLAPLRALAGDDSDGIPGLPMIGPQRAAHLLASAGWRWPLPAEALPDPGQRAQVAIWRDIMELIEPPRRPEDETGEGYFSVDFRSEWTRPDNDVVRDFFSTFQLASLSERLSNGRLW